MHGSDYFVGLTPTLLCGTTADPVGQGVHELLLNGPLQ